MSELIAVFAGGYYEYRRYIREEGLTEREAIWATRRSIMGVHFSEYVKVGSYQDHPDYVFMWNYVRATMIPRDPERFKTPPLPFTVGV